VECHPVDIVYVSVFPITMVQIVFGHGGLRPLKTEGSFMSFQIKTFSADPLNAVYWKRVFHHSMAAGLKQSTQ